MFFRRVIQRFFRLRTAVPDHRILFRLAIPIRIGGSGYRENLKQFPGTQPVVFATTGSKKIPWRLG
jgi:hypothetical protein